jgi:hypothetical protein
MIQFLKTLFQLKQPRLPTVPEFLRDGVKVGDSLILSIICNGQVSVIFDGYEAGFTSYPINTKLSNFTAKGWVFAWHDGKETELHIKAIERNGKVVAQGQEYT